MPQFEELACYLPFYHIHYTAYHLPIVAGMGTVLRPSTTGTEVANPLGPLRECAQPQLREAGWTCFYEDTMRNRALHHNKFLRE
jgi:hypothetical protein